MSRVTRRLRSLRGNTAEGFTLVELVVAMSLSMILVAVTISTVVGSQKAVTTTKQQVDLNEEARQAINRMARDIRQATKVVAAVNPDRPSFNAASLVAIRFESDFDGDGCIAGTAPSGVNPAPACQAYNPSNPEDLTYCFEPLTTQLFVIDNATLATAIASTDTTCSGGEPLLAGNVGSFKIEYRSNLYRYDLNPSDGLTTWRELDEAAPPIGNSNGLLDPAELANTDSVVINMVMRMNGREQVYRTQVDMRNTSK